MNDDNYGELMNRILTDVMEQMAFMFVSEAEPDAKPDEDASFVRVAMIFHGPLEGELTLIASERMCLELAANILGLEEDDPMVIDGAIDALKEILNVICGHLLTGIAGEGPAFDMAPPAAKRLSPEEWEALDLSEKTCFFSVEDHPMLMQLRLERGKTCRSEF
jgi:CheY-specific phosphatase CheX